MDVTAAVCYAPNEPLRIETVQLREPRAGEVLIEMKAAGLCHSDYHQIDGSIPAYPYPVILGHEGAGIVRQVGPGVTSVKPGDHVVPSSVPECNVCGNCHSHKTNLCQEFFTSFSAESPFSKDGKPIAQYSGTGTFASFTVVKEIAVTKIRDDVPFEVACYVGCGVVTGMGSVLNVARVEAGSSVIVFGLGGIGLNVIQGAKLAGAHKIIGVDINPARGDQARHFGATHFVNPKEIEGDLVQHLAALTNGGADYTFECVGNTELMNQAFESSRMGYGVTTIVGAAPSGKQLSIAPFSLLMGRTLKSAVLGNVRVRSDMPKIFDWYKDGLINLDDMITHTMPLEQINEGFGYMKSGTSIRSVVTF